MTRYQATCKAILKIGANIMAKNIIPIIEPKIGNVLLFLGLGYPSLS